MNGASAAHPITMQRRGGSYGRDISWYTGTLRVGSDGPVSVECGFHNGDERESVLECFQPDDPQCVPYRDRLTALLNHPKVQKACRPEGVSLAKSVRLFQVTAECCAILGVPERISKDFEVNSFVEFAEGGVTDPTWPWKWLALVGDLPAAVKWFRWKQEPLADPDEVAPWVDAGVFSHDVVMRWRNIGVTDPADVAWVRDRGFKHPSDVAPRVLGTAAGQNPVVVLRAAAAWGLAPTELVRWVRDGGLSNPVEIVAWQAAGVRDPKAVKLLRQAGRSPQDPFPVHPSAD